MTWSQDIPHLSHVDDEGNGVAVTVIAGALAGLTPPPPPPNSWASRADSDVAIWHVTLEPGASWTMPPTAHPDTVRTVYLFEGDRLVIGGDSLESSTGAVVRSNQPTMLRSDPSCSLDTQLLVLQGRPIAEPVAQYGPFVMNDRAEIEQAFADYQRTGFGGWPWPENDPVHGHDPGRFARRSNGVVERPTQRA